MKKLITLFTIVTTLSSSYANDVKTFFTSSSGPNFHLIKKERSSIDLESISERMKIQVPSEVLSIDKIQERIQNRNSGDDVGNGGDHLRSKIMADINSIANDSGLKVGSLRNLLIISDLGTPFAQMKNEDSEEIVTLLEKEFWVKAYEDGFDMRALLLSLVVDVSERSKLLDVYSMLSQQEGRPHCFYESSKIGMKTIEKSFSSSHRKSAKESIRLAMKECSDANYSDCFVSKSDYSGFGNRAQYKTIVIGHRYEKSPVSKAQKKGRTM